MSARVLPFPSSAPVFRAPTAGRLAADLPAETSGNPSSAGVSPCLSAAGSFAFPDAAPGTFSVRNSPLAIDMPYDWTDEFEFDMARTTGAGGDEPALADNGWWDLAEAGFILFALVLALTILAAIAAGAGLGALVSMGVR